MCMSAEGSAWGWPPEGESLPLGMRNNTLVCSFNPKRTKGQWRGKERPVSVRE